MRYTAALLCFIHSLAVVTELSISAVLPFTEGSDTLESFLSKVAFEGNL